MYILGCFSVEYLVELFKLHENKKKEKKKTN
jgi:hypothetical protein